MKEILRSRATGRKIIGSFNLPEARGLSVCQWGYNYNAMKRFKKLYFKHDFNKMCHTILEEQLAVFHIDYKINSIGEIEIPERISERQYSLLEAVFLRYGISIVTDKKSMLIQKTKAAIIEIIHQDKKISTSKMSSYLAGKMNHSYGYLSNVFSEVAHTSIENFIIIQKIERAKQLLAGGEFTLTEIAFKLNYSSVAHLSNQFKKTIGISPSAFQRILKSRITNTAD